MSGCSSLHLLGMVFHPSSQCLIYGDNMVLLSEVRASNSS